MLTVHRPIVRDSQSDTWIGPAPWIVTPPPGPKTLWATSHDCRVNIPSADRGYPLVIHRAQGTIIEDIDGNRYLDFSAGEGVCSTGHCHPHVVRAVKEQAGKLIHAGGNHSCCASTIKLTEKLAQIAPGQQAKQVLLTNSGPESVEAAVQLARHSTQRKIILAFDGVSYSNIEKYMPYGDISAVRELFDKQIVAADQVAAIFVEPIRGESCVVPPAEFLSGLQSLCDKYGILLVIDETRTGIGRTGKIFCCDHFGVDPDIVLLADGLASGMPIGALIARESIMSCGRDRPVCTASVSPVSCAAGLATIGVLEKHLISHVEELSSIALDKLVRIADRHNCIASPRGIGLMLAVDIVNGRRLRTPGPKLRDQIVSEAFGRGLLLVGFGQSGIRLTPPLCANRIQMEVGLDVFEEAVATVSIY